MFGVFSPITSELVELVWSQSTIGPLVVVIIAGKRLLLLKSTNGTCVFFNGEIVINWRDTPRTQREERGQRRKQERKESLELKI